ncbi:MAG: acylphosphatase [Bacteroidia bacterium]|nr:acylphosphatase [Bacteroidia bacterium]MCO5253685.1 acylphosphatase [Bacteroidota bacterium]MCZ2129614.1 acylphosphatase [Bacteroidia bacterium]
MTAVNKLHTFAVHSTCMLLRKKNPKLTDVTTVEIHVFGFVQGVYYRKFTKEIAIKLNIKGWVKNLDDGSVLIMASGEQNSIELFIEKCKEGNIWSKVSKVEVTPAQNAKPFTNYVIIRKV